MTMHHHGNRLRVKPWRPVWKSKQNARGQLLQNTSAAFKIDINVHEDKINTQEWIIKGKDTLYFLGAMI